MQIIIYDITPIQINFKHVSIEEETKYLPPFSAHSCHAILRSPHQHISIRFEWITISYALRYVCNNNNNKAKPATMTTN